MHLHPPKDRHTALTRYLAEIEAKWSAGDSTEHTHRSTLEALLKSYSADLTTVNEPKRVKCGAPDLLVAESSSPTRLTLGYIEAKDIGVTLTDAEKSGQLKRYLAALDNLILTDYLEFRWYVGGVLRRQAALAQPGKSGRLTRLKSGSDEVDDLLVNFLSQTPQPIASPDELARQMARLTHLIRDIIITAFETGQASDPLRDMRRVFAEMLIPDLTEPHRAPLFADMYAQTLAYGLFAARSNHPAGSPFQRVGAANEIPKTNPFLRKLFYNITGPELDDEPFAGFVDDLVQLLAQADMAAILAHFGKRAGSDDFIIHFYETFLAAYDPALRERRGVYYTPGPVVSYIVRSVDALLKQQFGLVDGLADASTLSYQAPPLAEGLPAPEPHAGPRTLILDPAAGTATFLYQVVDHIRQQYMAAGLAGEWDGYVKEHLLPRLYGFELLMAPYAVAHLKLGLQLAAQDLDPPLRPTWAYKFGGDERLNLFLSNTLEEATRRIPALPGIGRAVAEEANAAARVKGSLPIMIILGNPPYSGQSANRSEAPTTIAPGESYTAGWRYDAAKQSAVPVRSVASRRLENRPEPTFIGQLVRDYYFVDGQPLGERNPKWLQDDYVKFIRWAQWRLERTGSGVLALITNHGYLDNPTFRGMRQSLLTSFDAIYILNLHGNAKKRETAPGGGKDENVFDIQQGVAIGIFVKRPPAGQEQAGPAKVYYADLWGERAAKYSALAAGDVTNTAWTPLAPQSPAYLFIPQNTDLQEEYETGWPVTDIFPVNSVGVVTARDSLTIHWTKEQARQTVKDFAALPPEEAREKYQLGKDARDWQVTLAQADLQNSSTDKTRFEPDEAKLTPILYRPFDVRHTYYTGQTRGFICMPRKEVMGHLLRGENLALITTRQTRDNWSASVTDAICAHKSGSMYDISYAFPLYLYPAAEAAQKRLIDAAPDWTPDEQGRVPNLNPAFVRHLQERLGLRCQPPLAGETAAAQPTSAFTPEEVFHYIYAVFHSAAWRDRYAEQLRLDFPRVPLTGDVALFRRLAELGRELAAWHLLKPAVSLFAPPRYPVKGDNVVGKGYPKYNDVEQQVYLNKTQYFEPVTPEVWEFQVGGYQVAHKWLKDRQGRALTDADRVAYRKTVLALQKTIELMAGIDAAIPDWPLA